MKASDFSKFLTQYLTHYLPVQRNLSSNTIRSYRDTFKLLLIFCRDEKGFNIAKLNLSKLDKKCIEDFLLWLTNTRGSSPSTYNQRLCAIHAFGNVKKCAVGKHPKSEKHGNTAQFSEVERSGTQENCGGIGSGCRLRLRPLPVLRRRQSQRVAHIDPNAVVVDKNIAENDRFDLFSR